LLVSIKLHVLVTLTDHHKAWKIYISKTQVCNVWKLNIINLREYKYYSQLTVYIVNVKLTVRGYKAAYIDI
jgi:hypothetical protein